MEDNIIIRQARMDEHHRLGQLLVEVYSTLPGFPAPEEQPRYFDYLLHIGERVNKKGSQLIIALDDKDDILGGVVYFSDLKYYGSGGRITKIKNGCGFRLLAVSQMARGKGLGKLLSQYCIETARKEGQTELYIHSTRFMERAWAMYENMGFTRYEPIDFKQDDLEVFGFVLEL